MSDRDEEETNRKSGIAYAAALALFASVVVFCGFGWLLDRWLGTAPWFLGGGVVLGATVGLFEFFRLSSRTY
ncbi:MAG TPA: AtpZ/AtpI family protein [Pyrinomonadaceae bacterium]|nr:AtpZ/AtpI family protein [Pyrinomonadaceae bacterium]